MGRPDERSGPMLRQHSGGQPRAPYDHGASCSSALTAAHGNTAADTLPLAASGNQAVSGATAAVGDGVRFSVLRFGDGSIFHAPVLHLGGSSLAHGAGAEREQAIGLCDSDMDTGLGALPAPEPPATPFDHDVPSLPSSALPADGVRKDEHWQSPPEAATQQTAGSGSQAMPVRPTVEQPGMPLKSPPLKRIRRNDADDTAAVASRRMVTGEANTAVRAGSGGAAAEGGDAPCFRRKMH